MEFSGKLPQSKFKVGQNVYLRDERTLKVTSPEIYTIFQILIRSSGILKFPEEFTQEPYKYSIIMQKTIGEDIMKQFILWDVEEDLLVAV